MGTPNDTTAAIVALRKEGYSFSEIGARLGISKDAAQKRHRRAAATGLLLPSDRPLYEAAALGGRGPGGGEPSLLSEEAAGSPGRCDGECSCKGLRESNRDLLRRLSKANASKEELVEAVYQAAKDGLSGLVLDTIPAPRPPKAPGETEVALAVLSDWQLAKRTSTYNSDVCEERIERLAERIVRLTQIQRADHAVDDLHVHVLGDIVEGELIFPGQAHQIDASLYRQVTLDGPRILGNFLRRMLANFERVHVTAVIGNHGALGGRARQDYNPETNADRMLYRIVQQILAGEERLTWNIPDGPGESTWYAVNEIGKYRTLLLHGDQFRGTSGLPWYGIQKKAGGWALGAIDEIFDDIDFGHFHQPTRLTLNRVTARCNGSTESDNGYAREQLAAVGQPSQGLRFVHPSKGMVTAEYTVWL